MELIFYILVINARYNKETELEIQSVGALSLNLGDNEIEQVNLEVFIHKILENIK